MNTLSNTARHDMLAALLLLINGGTLEFQIPAGTAISVITCNDPFCSSNTNGVGAIDETDMADASVASGSATAINKVQVKTSGAASVGYMTAGLSSAEVILDDNVFDTGDSVTVQAGGTITMPAS